MNNIASSCAGSYGVLMISIASSSVDNTTTGMPFSSSTNATKPKGPSEATTFDVNKPPASAWATGLAVTRPRAAGGGGWQFFFGPPLPSSTLSAPPVPAGPSCTIGTVNNGELLSTLRVVLAPA